MKAYFRRHMAMGIFSFQFSVSISIAETKVLEKEKNLVCCIQIKAPTILASFIGSLLLRRKTSKERTKYLKIHKTQFRSSAQMFWNMLKTSASNLLLFLVGHF